MRRAYGAPSAGRGSASPLLGQNDIARSACAVIVSDGLTPRFAETAARRRRAGPGGRRRRWYGSITPVSGESPIGAAAEEVRGQRDVEQVAPSCRPGRRRSPRRAAGHLVAAGIQVGVRLAVALLAVSSPSPNAVRLAVRGQRVVERLHDQRDDRPLGPARRLDSERTRSASGGGPAAPSQASQRGDASAAVGQQRRQQRPSRWSPCRSGPARCGCRSSGWNDDVIATPLGEVDVARAAVAVPRAEDRLGVGAGQLAEPVGQPRQRARSPHPVQQLSGCRRCRPRARPARR